MMVAPFESFSGLFLGLPLPAIWTVFLRTAWSSLIFLDQGVGDDDGDGLRKSTTFYENAGKSMREQGWLQNLKANTTPIEIASVAQSLASL